MTTTAPMMISTGAAYGRPEGIDAVVYRLGLALVAWARARVRLDGDPREATARRSATVRAADAAYDAARARAAAGRLV